MRQAIKLIAFYFCLFIHLLPFYYSLLHALFPVFKKVTNNKHECKDKDIRGKKNLFYETFATFFVFHGTYFYSYLSTNCHEKNKKITLNARYFCERFVTFSFFILEKKTKVLQQNNTKQTPLKATFLGIIKLNIQVLHF